MEEIYFTIEEAAEKIGVHPKTIRRYIYSGKLAAQKIGGQWRVYQSAINEYFQSCKGSCSENPGQDDFCVFMDGDYFSSQESIQICSIIDCYIENSEILKDIAKELMDASLDSKFQNQNCRIHYIRDSLDKKVRFVLWGTVSYILDSLEKLRPYEEKGERHGD